MSPVRYCSSGDVNHVELLSRLITLTEDGTYTLTQVNGQRIFKKSPLLWTDPEPSRSCEVFIGRIPNDCFEDVLVPLFQQAGELYEFRLMINFSGWSRGYAFAMYSSEMEAGNAIKMFDKYTIRPSWQLGVVPSINNCRIYISRIPPSTSSEEIVRLLYSITEEVLEVRVRRTMLSCAAVVEYKSHRGAAIARKTLVAAASAAWGAGARPSVDWSQQLSPQVMRQYREVGRYTEELGVVVTRALEESPPAPHAAPTFQLEPWSMARRLRMIHEAQQRSARVAHQWQTATRDVPPPPPSRGGVWSPPPAPATAAVYSARGGYSPPSSPTGAVRGGYSLPYSPASCSSTAREQSPPNAQYSLPYSPKSCASTAREYSPPNAQYSLPYSPDSCASTARGYSPPNVQYSPESYAATARKYSLPNAHYSSESCASTARGYSPPDAQYSLSYPPVSMCSAPPLLPHAAPCSAPPAPPQRFYDLWRIRNPLVDGIDQLDPTSE